MILISDRVNNKLIKIAFVGDIYNPKFIQPPPTVSGTPFPTSAAVPTNDSVLYYCQMSNAPTQEPTAAVTSKPTVTVTSYPTRSAPSDSGFGAEQVSK